MGIQRFRRGLWLSTLGLGNGRVGWRRNRWRDREQRLRLLWRTGSRLWRTALRRPFPLRLLSRLFLPWVGRQPKNPGRPPFHNFTVTLAGLGGLVKTLP